MASCGAETISEQLLIPVLAAILHQCPFRILGLHCDNGSELLNHMVVKLLNKLLVEEFTRSCAYRTTDNALVEGTFYTAYFNPYLNFHRGCGYATVVTNARGKCRRTSCHRDYQMPYEKLKSLSELGELFEARNHPRHAGAPGGRQQRRRSGAPDTKSQADLVGPLPQTTMRALWKCRGGESVES